MKGEEITKLKNATKNIYNQIENINNKIDKVIKFIKNKKTTK